MLNFLHPGLLWLAGLAVPLVVLYVLKARRRSHTQTALWLWREAHQELEARVPWRRLRRDWLLMLQLLILALLVLAAAGPYRRAIGGGGDVAVVVDASASMLAGQRPAELEGALRRLIDSLGTEDRMALVRAAAEPEVLAPLGSDRPSLLAAVARARPAAAPTGLAPGVELAESLVGADGTVVVVTDPAGEVPPAAGRLEVVRVGEAGDNVGIVALGVRPADASGRDHQIFARLRNASPRAVTGSLLLSVDGDTRDAAELTIPAGEEVGHTLRLVGPEAAAIEVIWRGAVADALAVDDRAFWWLAPPPERRYRVRGAAGAFLRRALRATAGWRLGALDEAVDLEILVGESPTDEGPPFLWVAPPAPRGEVAGAAVLRWDKTHPALRFVDLRALRLGSVPRIDRPPGARVLAESTAGPLVLAGSHRQRRYLLWAFDPMQTDLPLRVAWPLMVRHALEHLVPAGGPIEGGVATGPAIATAPVPWPVVERRPGDSPGTSADGESVTLTSPTGRSFHLVPRGGTVRLPALEEVGLWHLAGLGREVRFAASLLDAAESQLTPRVPGTGRSKGVDAAPAAGRAVLRGLWRPLILAALALLLLEAAAFHRRWSL